MDDLSENSDNGDDEDGDTIDGELLGHGMVPGKINILLYFFVKYDKKSFFSRPDSNDDSLVILVCEEQSVWGTC